MCRCDNVSFIIAVIIAPIQKQHQKAMCLLNLWPVSVLSFVSYTLFVSLISLLFSYCFVLLNFLSSIKQSTRTRQSSWHEKRSEKQKPGKIVLITPSYLRDTGTSIWGTAVQLFGNNYVSSLFKWCKCGWQVKQ